MRAIVQRFEDMSQFGKLQLLEQDDGDIIIGIAPDPNEPSHVVRSVEFCNSFAGGGQSPNTRAALLKLMDAMEADNKEHPQYRG